MALMNFTPDTVVKLLTGVPLDPTYVNTRDFPNVAAQQSFFNSYVLQTFEQFSYQREKSVIRVPIPYEQAVKANYCMYKNSNYSTKWFYAFITSIEYVNPEMSAVTIVTDVIQTWLFDYILHPCLIERETVASDNPYEHTIPEGLEYGPIKIADESFTTGGDYFVVLAYFDNQDTGGQLINNIFSGVNYQIFSTSDAGISSLNAKLTEMDNAGLADNIVGMFMIPNFMRLDQTFSANIPLTTGSIDGYTPRNKKLYGWPYRYLGIGWGMGAENLLRYELVNGSTLTLHFKGSLNLEAQALLWPANYAGLAENYGEGILLDNLPQCSWVSNAYANWLARNKNTYGLNLINSGLGMVGAVIGAFMGVPTPGGLSAFESAFGLMAQSADRSNYPNQLAGQAGASTIWASLSRIGISVKKYEITQEYAKVIDQFFDRFGYKVSRNGLPATKSRTRWNYIKTSGVSITGPLPSDHLQQLEQIYNQGTTFWHDNNIGDYTAANGFS